MGGGRGGPVDDGRAGCEGGMCEVCKAFTKASALSVRMLILQYLQSGTVNLSRRAASKTSQASQHQAGLTKHSWYFNMCYVLVKCVYTVHMYICTVHVHVYLNMTD